MVLARREPGSSGVGDPAVLPAALQPAERAALAGHSSGSALARQGVVSAPSDRCCRPLGVEVRRVEPGFPGRPQAGPVAVGHREPGGVAVAALDDQVLAEHALEGEAEPLRRAAARQVQAVALPFEAAIALAEHPVGEEEDHLAGGAGPLQHRRQADVPDLDRAGLGPDPRQAGDPGRGPDRPIGQGEEQRIGLARDVHDPGAIGGFVGERAVGQVVPDRVVGPVGGEERRRVPWRQRIEPQVAALEAHRPRPGRRGPAGDRLAEAGLGRHGRDPLRGTCSPFIRRAAADRNLGRRRRRPRGCAAKTHAHRRDTC